MNRTQRIALARRRRPAVTPVGASRGHAFDYLERDIARQTYGAPPDEPKRLLPAQRPAVLLDEQGAPMRISALPDRIWSDDDVRVVHFVSTLYVHPGAYDKFTLHDVTEQ